MNKHDAYCIIYNIKHYPHLIFNIMKRDNGGRRNGTRIPVRRRRTMRTVRRLLGFVLAVGLMVSAMSVFASGGSYSYTEKPFDSNTYYDTLDYSSGGIIINHPSLGEAYYGIYPPSKVAEGTQWQWMAPGHFGTFFTFTGGQWVGDDGAVYDGPYASAGGSTKKAKGPRVLSDQEVLEIKQRAEAEAVQHAASEEGFADVGDMYRAAENNMSAGEFYNNAVVSTPGIENAVTVGQGGNLIVDGQVTNMSATITKVTNRAYVDSVRIEQEGRVLNVVDVSYPAVNATINFYMPGITGEEDIVALQYNAGTWVNIEVAEIRADHVTLNMTGNGVVAFIAK